MSFKLKKIFDSYDMPQELIQKLEDGCFTTDIYLEWRVHTLHNPISKWLVDNGAEMCEEVLIEIHR